MKRFAPGSMQSCHLFQLKTALYFGKSALQGGLKSSAHALSLAIEAYADFYLHQRMGHKEL